MNRYKIRIFTTFLSVLAMMLFSCGDPGLSGIFIPKGKSRISAVEFKDGVARFTDSFLGIKQGCMDFKVKEDKVEIKHPFTGSIIFKIVDNDTLKCEIPGMNGFYLRQK